MGGLLLDPTTDALVPDWSLLSLVPRIAMPSETEVVVGSLLAPLRVDTGATGSSTSDSASDSALVPSARLSNALTKSVMLASLLTLAMVLAFEERLPLTRPKGPGIGPREFSRCIRSRIVRPIICAVSAEMASISFIMEVWCSSTSCTSLYKRCKDLNNKTMRDNAQVSTANFHTEHEKN